MLVQGVAPVIIHWTLSQIIFIISLSDILKPSDWVSQEAGICSRRPSKNFSD